jgi:hypothetical protein
VIPDETIRLETQDARKQEKSISETVVTKNTVLSVKANAAGKEKGTKSNIKKADVMENRSLGRKTNEDAKRDLIGELDERSHRTQPYNEKSNLDEHRPSPAPWLQLHIKNQNETLQQQLGSASEKQNVDIRTENYNTVSLQRGKGTEKEYTEEKDTQNNGGIYLTVSLRDEKPRLESTTNRSKSMLSMHTSVESTERESNWESYTNILKHIPLLEAQSPWFLYEPTSVQYNAEQVSKASASEMQGLTKPFTDSSTNESISRVSTVGLDTTQSNVKYTCGAKCNTEYKFTRPPPTIQDATAAVRDIFSAENLSVPVKAQNHVDSTTESTINSSEEDRITTESFTDTSTGMARSTSTVAQINCCSTMSQEKSRVGPDVEIMDSVPVDGINWLSEGQAQLNGDVESFTSTTLPSSNSNESCLFKCNTGTSVTTEDTSKGFSTTLVTAEVTIRKTESEFMTELTSNLQTPYDNDAFPGKHVTMEYVQNHGEMNTKDFNVHPNIHDVKIPTESDDAPRTSEGTFRTHTTTIPLQITEKQKYDIIGISGIHSNGSYKSPMEYDSGFQKTDPQPSTSFGSSTALPYRKLGVETGTAPPQPPSPSIGETGCTVNGRAAKSATAQLSRQETQNTIGGCASKPDADWNTEQSVIQLRNTEPKGWPTETSSKNPKPDLFHIRPLYQVKEEGRRITEANNATTLMEQGFLLSATTGGANEKQSDSKSKSKEHSSELPRFLWNTNSNVNGSNITLPPEQVELPEHIGEDKTHCVTESTPEENQSAQYDGNEKLGKESVKTRKHFPIVIGRLQEYITEPNTGVSTVSPQSAKHADMEIKIGSVSTYKRTEEHHVTHLHLSQSSEFVTESYNLTETPRVNAETDSGEKETVTHPPRGQYVETGMQQFNTSIIDKDLGDESHNTSSKSNSNKHADCLAPTPTGVTEHSAAHPAYKEKDHIKGFGVRIHHEFKSQKELSQHLPNAPKQTHKQRIFTPSDGVSSSDPDDNLLVPTVTTPHRRNQVPPLYLEEKQQQRELPQWSQNLPNVTPIRDQFAYSPQYHPNDDINVALYTRLPFPQHTPNEEPVILPLDASHLIPQNLPKGNSNFETYRRTFQDHLEGLPTASDHKPLFHHSEKLPYSLPQPSFECESFTINELRICIGSCKIKSIIEILYHLFKETMKHSPGEFLVYDLQSEESGVTDSSVEHSSGLTIDIANSSSVTSFLEKDVTIEENAYSHQKDQLPNSQAFKESPNEDEGRDKHSEQNLGEGHLYYENTFEKGLIGFIQDIMPRKQVDHETNGNSPFTEIPFHKEQLTPNEFVYLNKQGPFTQEEPVIPDGPTVDELYKSSSLKQFANYYYRNTAQYVANSLFSRPRDVYIQDPSGNDQFISNHGDGMHIQEKPNGQNFQKINIKGKFFLLGR